MGAARREEAGRARRPHRARSDRARRRSRTTTAIEPRGRGAGDRRRHRHVVEERAEVVEHRAEPDDRRHERRPEARGLRREFLPPVVIRARRQRRRRTGCRRGGRRACCAARATAAARRGASARHIPSEQHRRAVDAPDAVAPRGTTSSRARASDEEAIREQVILQPDQPGQRPLARRAFVSARASASCSCS